VTYRDTCGTLQGLLAHQGAGEAPCGYCLHGEAAARISAESIPGRPSRPAAAPVLPEEIRRRREELLAAVGVTGRAARRAIAARDDLAARRDARRGTRGSTPARRAG
jgi:hypothetical protein